MSVHQRGQLTRFHSELLAGAIPGLAHSYRPFLADFRLTRPKDWGDVYAYTPDGQLRGWTRHLEEGGKEFNVDGLLVLTRDAKGRCSTALPVKYQFIPLAEKHPPWDWPPVRFTAQAKVVTCEYRNDADITGRAVE